MGETNNIHVSAIFPAELRARLIRQVAKETAARAKQISISEIIRWAVEDYLDMHENATFISDEQALQARQPRKEG